MQNVPFKDSLHERSKPIFGWWDGMGGGGGDEELTEIFQNIV